MTDVSKSDPKWKEAVKSHIDTLKAIHDGGKVDTVLYSVQVDAITDQAGVEQYIKVINEEFGQIASINAKISISRYFEHS